MLSTLDQLCTVLDAELERQELIQALVQAQHEALRVQDRKSLEARTEAISVLARDARDAESGRQALFDRLAVAYELPADRRNMSGLIAACPAPFSARLKGLQTALRETLESTQAQVRANGRLARRALRSVSVTLSAAHPSGEGSAPSYAHPHTVAGRKAAPVLLDQRG